jgi:hypothetical protein
MRSGMIGIVILAIMGVVILPPMPVSIKKNPLSKYYRYPLMFLQWLIIPFTMIAFGSIPAIDAQTRLLFGKYLGFWVTEKKKTN